jgi:hypothetical protein
MRGNLFFIFCLILCSVVISCQRKTADDELAERMAKSENFKGMMVFWKEKSKILIKLPDSTKNRFKLIKMHLDSLQKNNKLNLRQKADSIMKIGRSEPSVDRIMSDTQNAKRMTPFLKGFNAEFPEIRKMAKEERSIVFKKAAAIWFKNLKEN